MREGYTPAEKNLVLEILERSTKTSPVKLSFGFVNSTGHCMKGIVIESCPGAIVKMLIDKKCIVDLEDGKMHVIHVE